MWIVAFIGVICGLITAARLLWEHKGETALWAFISAIKQKVIGT